jgi:hypothetical protein
MSEAVATALPALAELLHTLIHDFILCHGDKVWSYLGISNQDFSAIYLKINQLLTLPPTANFTAAAPSNSSTNNNLTTPGNNTGDFIIKAQYDRDGNKIL